jgi:hypothetical protein
MFIVLGTDTTGTGPDDRLCQIAFKQERRQGISGLFKLGTL